MNSNFIYFLRPVRPDLIESFTPEEEAVMNVHFTYLKNLLKEKKLVLAGPSEEGKFGLVVLIADSREEARMMMENDPAIREKLMSGELLEFRVSLLGESM